MGRSQQEFGNESRIVINSTTEISGFLLFSGSAKGCTKVIAKTADSRFTLQTIVENAKNTKATEGNDKCGRCRCR